MAIGSLHGANDRTLLCVIENLHPHLMAIPADPR